MHRNVSTGTSLKTRRGHRRGRGARLPAVLILAELFMQPRIPLGTEAFPTPGLIMKVLYLREKSAYIPAFTAKLDQNP